MMHQWLLPLDGIMGTNLHSLKEPPRLTTAGRGRCCVCGQYSLNTVGTVGLERLGGWRRMKRGGLTRVWALIDSLCYSNSLLHLTPTDAVRCLGDLLGDIGSCC